MHSLPHERNRLRTLFLAQDQAAADYIGGKLGLVFVPPFDVIGIMDSSPDGRFSLLGGFVLTGRSAANVDLSLYAPRCFTRGVIRSVAHHVFVRLKCERATARCRRSNVVMRRQMEGFGWTLEGVQRHYWGPTKHDDAMVYGILRGECPWLF